jgi:diacylglycerol kinase family enzyme
MVGFGFDAFVAHQTNSLKNKGWRGTTLYFLALVSSFIKYKTAPIKIILDNKGIEEQIFSVSVGIGRFNGGEIMQAPQAVPDNGYFHVTIIHKIGICGILRNLGRLYSGKFVNDHRVSVFQSILIVTPETVAGEADGESFEDSKFDIHILLKKLRVIYNPSKYLT